MEHIQGSDREQLTLFPEALDDYIARDNPVRFLDVFIDRLDLKSLGFEHVVLKETSRPPYHPADLLKLYVYGYLNRIRSSRRLETESGRNLELPVLAGQARDVVAQAAHPRLSWPGPSARPSPTFAATTGRPSARCAANSPSSAASLSCLHLPALAQRARGLQAQVARPGLDLFGGELVAIDGSKVKAQNSKGRNFTQRKLKRQIKEWHQPVLARPGKIDDYLEELDQADEQEKDLPNKPNAEQLRQKIEVMKRRQAELRQLEEQMRQSGQSQISLTDPDSRSMPPERRRNHAECPDPCALTCGTGAAWSADEVSHAKAGVARPFAPSSLQAQRLPPSRPQSTGHRDEPLTPASSW